MIAFYNVEDLTAHLLIVVAAVLVIDMVSGLIIGPTDNGSDSSYNSGSSYNQGSSYNAGNSSISYPCYVCGEDAKIKYGSYYYCSTCYAYVKTVVDAEY